MMPNEQADEVWIQTRYQCLGAASTTTTVVSVVDWMTAQALVLSDDAIEIKRLETLIGCSQDELVNHYIEKSCYSDDLPEYVGGKSTPQERLDALRALWRTYREGEETARD